MTDNELRAFVRAGRLTLGDIYGNRSYHKHVESGEVYRYVFGDDTEEARLTGKNAIDITITGIRSGVAFYTVEGHTEKEFHFDLKSVMASFLEPINPDVDTIRELLEKREKRLKFLNGDIKEFPID